MSAPLLQRWRACAWSRHTAASARRGGVPVRCAPAPGDDDPPPLVQRRRLFGGEEAGDADADDADAPPPPRAAGAPRSVADEVVDELNERRLRRRRGGGRGGGGAAKRTARSSVLGGRQRVVRGSDVSSGDDDDDLGDDDDLLDDDHLSALLADAVAAVKAANAGRSGGASTMATRGEPRAAAPPLPPPPPRARRTTTSSNNKNNPMFERAATLLPPGRWEALAAAAASTRTVLQVGAHGVTAQLVAALAASWRDAAVVQLRLPPAAAGAGRAQAAAQAAALAAELERRAGGVLVAAAPRALWMARLAATAAASPKPTTSGGAGQNVAEPKIQLAVAGEAPPRGVWLDAAAAAADDSALPPLPQRYVVGDAATARGAVLLLPDAWPFAAWGGGADGNSSSVLPVADAIAGAGFVVCVPRLLSDADARASGVAVGSGDAGGDDDDNADADGSTPAAAAYEAWEAAGGPGAWHRYRDVLSALLRELAGTGEGQRACFAAGFGWGGTLALRIGAAQAQDGSSAQTATSSPSSVLAVAAFSPRLGAVTEMAAALSVPACIITARGDVGGDALAALLRARRDEPWARRGVARRFGKLPSGFVGDAAEPRAARRAAQAVQLAVSLFLGEAARAAGAKKKKKKRAAS